VVLGTRGATAVVVRAHECSGVDAVTDLRRVLFVDKPTAGHGGSPPARVEHDVTFTQRAVCGQPERMFLVGPLGESCCVAEDVAGTLVRAVLRRSEASAEETAQHPFGVLRRRQRAVRKPQDVRDL